MTAKTKYDVIRSEDDEVIGRVDLTMEESLSYRALAEKTDDQVPIRDIPHALFNLNEQWQYLSPETTVYLS